MNFYIIVDREIVSAFKLTSINGTIAKTRDEVLDAFNKITGKGGQLALPVEEIPKVLILTEATAALIEEEEMEWQKKGKYPLIVEIPCLDGHIRGKKSLTDAIREAIGVQI